MDTGVPHPCKENKDHVKAANKWCHTPDLVESDAGKFTPQQSAAGMAQMYVRTV